MSLKYEPASEPLHISSTLNPNPQAFVVRDIKGFMLPGMSVDTLDHELGMHNKAVQSKVNLP